MSQTDEAWDDLAGQLKKLGSTLKSRYRAYAGTESAAAPTEAEVKDALHTLAESVRAAFGTVGEVINDPEVREEATHAAGLFFDAVGTSFTQLGDDISKPRVEPDYSEPPSPTEAARWDPSEEEE